MAVISVYVMVSAVEALAAMPGLRRPARLPLRAPVLAGFILPFLGLAAIWP